MKRFMWLLIIPLISLMSCSKDDDSANDTVPAPANPSGNTIGTPTGTYTRMALLEYHSAAWCGSCPDAFVKRDQVMANFSGRVIPVEIHQSDAMQIPLFMTLDATFTSNPAFGMINRVPSLGNVLLNRTQWMSNATVQLSQPAKCGLAIKSSVSGTTLSVEVQAAFKEALTGNHNLTVYLVANEVTGSGSTYDQVNSYNADPSSPYYNLGNPIAGFRHRYVVRKALTANLGDAIDGSLLTPGGLLKRNFTADITGYDAAGLYVVAFVNKTGTSSTTHEVLNACMAKAGTLQDWK